MIINKELIRVIAFCFNTMQTKNFIDLFNIVFKEKEKTKTRVAVALIVVQENKQELSIDQISILNSCVQKMKKMNIKLIKIVGVSTEQKKTLATNLKISKNDIYTDSKNIFEIFKNSKK